MTLNRLEVIVVLGAISSVQSLAPSSRNRKPSFSTTRTSLQYQEQDQYETSNRKKGNDPLEEFETNRVDGMPLGTSSPESSYDWLNEIEELDEAGESYAWMLGAEEGQGDDAMFDPFGNDANGASAGTDEKFSLGDDGEEYDETFDDDTSLDYQEEGAAVEESMEEAEQYIEESEEEYIEEDDVYPTFELLKEWTMNYMDLIDLAGGGMTRVSVGMQHVMHEAFVFTSPKIGPIGKPDFVTLMSYYNDNGMDLASAVPDLSVEYEGWHQDPEDAYRLWVIARYSGTHLGTASIPNSGLKLCPPKDVEAAKFTTGPQMESFLWTPDGKLLWQTMGYVGDEYTGSNSGYGGLDGFMVSMGLPYLYLEATTPVRDMVNWFTQFRGDDIPKTVSPFSNLPTWWHERKKYDWNVNR